MHRLLAFTERNRKEILRDPLSYIFCLGFPLVMLIIMTLVDQSIPKEAGMTVFHIENLSGGILVFAQTFIMLFTAITVAKDRSGSFLVRMYATPMTSRDLIGGYILPMLLLYLIQAVITVITAFIIALITKADLKISGLILGIVLGLPSAVLFIGFGLLAGTLFNEKAAPGMCSILISLGSFLGCIWFDADATGGVMLKICRCLPFYYCTKTVRAAMQLQFTGNAFWKPLAIVSVCAVVILTLAILAFRRRMRADLA